MSEELPIAIPKGHGFRPLKVEELRLRTSLLGPTRGLLDVCLIYERPRRQMDCRYVVSADIGDGLGQDRTSIDVLRLATLKEPCEQVAHFYSDVRTPTQAAYVIDALGHYYQDMDGLEALAAIETNNHGLSTQDTLQLHLGYGHFYVWEVADAMDPNSRFTKKIGWVTTRRTRPIILDKLFEALTVPDPITGYPDLRLNSPWTQEELADFQTEGALWEAEAARGAHDDAIMSVAIGYYVAHRLFGGESEPLSDRRRRHAESQARQEAINAGQPRDFRNTPYTSDEMRDWAGEPDEDVNATPYGIYR